MKVILVDRIKFSLVIYLPLTYTCCENTGELSFTSFTAMMTCWSSKVGSVRLVLWEAITVRVYCSVVSLSREPSTVIHPVVGFKENTDASFPPNEKI